MAAAYINQKFGADATMLVLSADHLILNQIGFIEAVNSAVNLAKNNRLVTFGIQPNKPETGYGYIESNGNQVIRFVEKPNFEDASKYVLSGKFLWNAGIFCFNASFFLAELEKHHQALHANIYHCLVDQKDSSLTTECFFKIESFSRLEDISIDYAIMEKSDSVSVVPCDIGWSDVGSWDSISALTKTDDHGNQIEAHVVMENTHNCFIKSEDTDRLISTVGLDNLIIVDTPDALLISDRNQVQDVKKIVSQLKKLNNDTYKIHRTVARPWGTYTVLETGDAFKIKRIVVKPAGSLSLQMHHHRSEHWIVVSGVAKIINGEQEVLIHPNQSTYIPAGQTHRLTNPGVLDCVMIEVQVGSYLGEDDIVRFTDIYGRC
jgi:mannose-1-phosphate guanylyltransferase